MLAMNPGTTEMKNMIDFGLNRLEKNPRQNNEAAAEASISGRSLAFVYHVSHAR